MVFNEGQSILTGQLECSQKYEIKRLFTWVLEQTFYVENPREHFYI